VAATRRREEVELKQKQTKGKTAPHRVESVRAAFLKSKNGAQDGELGVRGCVEE
jgi:hypothetical protein